jgi:hypothetical protein
MTRAARLLAFAAVVLAIACAVGWGDATARAASSTRPHVTEPGRFHDVYGARLATGPRRTLWLAETGADRSGSLRTEVFRFAAGRWRALPGRFRSTSNTPLSLAVSSAGTRGRPRPCVGFSGVHGEARIRCHSGRRWTEIKLPRRLRGMDLQGLGSSPRGGDVVALFARVGRRSTRIQVARLRGNGISPLGPALHLHGQVLATLGERAANVRSAAVDVGLEGLRHGRRWVATLRRGRWTRTDPITGHGSGPQLGGPVRLRGTLLEALTEAEGSWPMTVHAWTGGKWSELGGGPLNVGSARAQGSLDAVGDRAWVTWVQTGTASHGLFPTSYYAALLDPDGGRIERRILLWHGTSIGPGPAQVVAYRGRPVFLYMRQHGRKSGLQATVAFGPPAQRQSSRRSFSLPRSSCSIVAPATERTRVSRLI